MSIILFVSLSDQPIRRTVSCTDFNQPTCCAGPFLHSLEDDLLFPSTYVPSYCTAGFHGLSLLNKTSQTFRICLNHQAELWHVGHSTLQAEQVLGKSMTGPWYQQLIILSSPNKKPCLLLHNIHADQVSVISAVSLAKHYGIYF